MRPSTGIWKTAVRLMAPGGARGRLSILIYHRVLRQPDPLLPGEVDSRTFRWQMELVKNYWRVLPLREAAARLRAGRLPSRSLCITFDDGYADNAEVALPILLELDLPATFFVATGFLDGGRMWNDTVIEAVRRLPAGLLDLSAQGLGAHVLEGPASRAEIAQDILRRIKHRPSAGRHAAATYLERLCSENLPKDLMMRSDQVQALRAAGMDVGAHTVSHPILARLNPDESRREIAEGREVLESLLREPVRLFAYPNGRPVQDYASEHVAMVRSLGFETAVSTKWGVSTIRTDRWQLRRFTPWDRTPGRFVLRLLENSLRGE